MNERSFAPAPRPLWRRLLKPVGVIAVLVVVFGWLLPQLIDYQEAIASQTMGGSWVSCSRSGLDVFRPRR